jgi:hypothetical protein
MDRISGLPSLAAAVVFYAAALGPSGLAQAPTYTGDERIVLPASRDNQDVTLRLPARAPAGAVTLESLKDASGALISPQPSVTADAAAGGTVTLHFKDVHFWGEARLGLQIAGSNYTYVYKVQRGLELARASATGSVVGGAAKGEAKKGEAARPPVDAEAWRGTPAELWFYNPERSAVTPAWRLISDGEAICGVEAGGGSRRDCGSDDKWAQAKFPPGGSGRISIPIPDWWFHPWKGGDRREVAIELRYGAGETAQLQRINFTLGLSTTAGDLVPLWAWNAAKQIRDVLWALVWVAAGAGLLMLAQVMIPNLRKCLGMENQLDFLHERLRAIGSRVGDRLYTRSEQEIKSLRRGLGMDRQRKGFRSWVFDWPRVALSANTAEVSRLAGIVPRIDTRLRLTERLDEVQAATPESVAGDLPPTLCLERERQINAVRAILARQFITDAEEKSVSTMLDDVGDTSKSLKDFGERLEGRLAALRRQYKADACKQADERLKQTCGCATLLKDPPDPAPGGGYTTRELIARDLCVLKLEIIFRTIELRDRLAKNQGIADEVAAKLQSDDPVELARANALLSMLSEGVNGEDIKTALQKESWDAFYEPNTISDQDVIRASFQFRDKQLNRCAARAGFECWWHITVDGDKLDIYEHGWDVQFISPQGRLVVDPEIYDAKGNPVPIRSDQHPAKGKLEETVGAPKTDSTIARTFRGAVDAVITALVPVVTVAVTQGAGTLDVGKLILLGFTSQAIRAAVVPETTPAGKPAGT